MTDLEKSLTNVLMMVLCMVETADETAIDTDFAIKILENTIGDLSYDLRRSQLQSVIDHLSETLDQRHPEVQPMYAAWISDLTENLVDAKMD